MIPRTSLTAAEAAESMGCSVDQIYRWVDAGLLAKVPHTRSVLIPLAELDRFANSGREVAA